MLAAEILGIGSYVPTKVVTNDDLAQLMETSNEWIVKRTGIEERRWIERTDISTSDLAMKAVDIALEESKTSKEEIDMIIFATLSPDHFFPGSGCFLQAKMGLSNIPALDIRQQCTGFIYGISIADQYIRSGMYKKVLVVGAEIHSTGLDKTTRGRDVAVLFGDGAGAVVIGAKELNKDNQASQIHSTHLYSEGKYAKELWTPAAGSGMNDPERMSQRMLDEAMHFPQMNGKKVYMHAVKKMSESLADCLQHNQKSVADVDMFFFHQANLRINESVAEQLKIPAEKIYNTIQRFGNTTAATIPLGMHEAWKAGKLQKGMLVGLSAFGSGFTWGAALLRL